MKKTSKRLPPRFQFNVSDLALASGGGVSKIDAITVKQTVAKAEVGETKT